MNYTDFTIYDAGIPSFDPFNKALCSIPCPISPSYPEFKTTDSRTSHHRVPAFFKSISPFRSETQRHGLDSRKAVELLEWSESNGERCRKTFQYKRQSIRALERTYAPDFVRELVRIMQPFFVCEMTTPGGTYASC